MVLGGLLLGGCSSFESQPAPQFLAAKAINVGDASAQLDSKWAAYADYLQGLMEAVNQEWERVAASTKVYPKVGSSVSVKFVLNSQGEISRIIDVDSHSTDLGARACVSAITNRAPYGKWTEDMKAVLGDQQEMTFTFHYQ